MDLTAHVLPIQSTLRSLRLIYVPMSPCTLSLLSSIIDASRHSLRDIQLELVIPIDVEQTANNNNDDSLRVSGLLTRIMTTCSALPQLTAFGVDLINFPLDCYAYFRRHFATQHHFLALRTLRIFVCKESIADEANLDALLAFLRSHAHLNATHMIVNDIGEDGIWDDLVLHARQLHQQDFDVSRFRVSEADAAALDACCRRIIDALSASPLRCATLSSFSLCHYLGESGDLGAYVDIVARLLSKVSRLSSLALTLNRMSDAALARLLRRMRESETLMRSLEHVELEAAKLDDYVDAPMFAQVLGEDDEDEDGGGEWRDIERQHFGRGSVLEFARLLDDCASLACVSIKCYLGVELAAFAQFAASVAAHRHLSRLTLRNVQRRRALLDALSRVLRDKKHSFLCEFVVVFSGHYLDALRRDKYCIPHSLYEPLCDDEAGVKEEDDGEAMEKQMRPDCDVATAKRFVDAMFESQRSYVRWLQGVQAVLRTVLSADAVAIVVCFLREEECLVHLGGLPTDIRMELKSYFLRCCAQDDSSERIINLNAWRRTHKDDDEDEGYDEIDID